MGCSMTRIGVRRYSPAALERDGQEYSVIHDCDDEASFVTAHERACRPAPILVVWSKRGACFAAETRLPVNPSGSSAPARRGAHRCHRLHRSISPARTSQARLPAARAAAPAHRPACRVRKRRDRRSHAAAEHGGGPRGCRCRDPFCRNRACHVRNPGGRLSRAQHRGEHRPRAGGETGRRQAFRVPVVDPCAGRADVGRRPHGRPEARPTDAYGRSKLAAERGLAELDLDWVALRLVLVYGPGVKGNMAQLLRLARSPYPLPLGGLTGRRSLLSLDNLVAALDTVLAAGPLRRPLIVADPQPLTVSEMITAMRRGLGRRPGLVRVPTRLLEAALRAAGRVRCLCAPDRLARR